MKKSSNKWITPDQRFNSKEEYILYLRHLAAYDFVKRYVKDNDVLEVGCGAGYGAHYLSKYASTVTAVDTANDAIRYSKSHYNEKNLSFEKINSDELPFDDSSFDVVLSFQVIEHIEKHNTRCWLSHIKRVLKDDGVFFVSTPNKRLRLLPFQKPWNEYHKKEYSRDELARTLKRVFAAVQICGLSANDEILSFERARVKQIPIDVYLWRPLSRLRSNLPLSSLKVRTLTRVKGAYLSSNHTQKPHFPISEGGFDNISLDSFIIDSTCSHERSIDFIGVAEKYLHSPTRSWDFKSI